MIRPPFPFQGVPLLPFAARECYTGVLHASPATCEEPTLGMAISVLGEIGQRTHPTAIKVQ